MQLARSNINNPYKMFQKAITLKEGSSRLEDLIKNEPNEIEISLLKIEHVDEKDQYLPVHPSFKSRSASNLPDQERGDEEEYVDDLAGFEVENEHKKTDDKR